MSGFQSLISAQPAPGVAGDFATTNARTNAQTIPGGFVAGAGGVTVGKFAWVQGDGVTVLNSPISLIGTSFPGLPIPPTGLVARENQALITNYLDAASMVIHEGGAVTLYNEGDFYTNFLGDPDVPKLNVPIYASNLDGTPIYNDYKFKFGGSIGANFTAVSDLVDDTLIVVTNTVGTIFPADSPGISDGDRIVGGAGGGIPEGTVIQSQVSGIPGGNGTYSLSVSVTAAAPIPVSTSSFYITVTSVEAGFSLQYANLFEGPGVPQGLRILDILNNAPYGGPGVYRLNTRFDFPPLPPIWQFTESAGIRTNFHNSTTSLDSTAPLITISSWGKTV